jgi:hypothetical protein
MAYILGEIFELSGEEAAVVLEIDPATYRKRLSRARQLLLTFMRDRCGVYDAKNPCRCRRQIDSALADGRLQRSDMPLARHPVRIEQHVLEQGAKEVADLMQVANVMRGHPEYAPPESMLARLRELLHGGRLALLRN